MSLPVIDLGDLRSGRPGEVDAVVEAIRAANREAGFFYVANHGVTDAQITQALTAGRRFFALPDDEKRAIEVDGRHRGYLGFGGAKMDGAAAPDLKESFVYGVERPVPDDEGPGDEGPGYGGAARLVGPNRWPAAVPELGPATYALFLSVLDAGRRLLSGIALALGLPREFFTPHLEHPLARGSLIHYPPQPEDPVPGQLGVDAHTDFGLVTLLWQDPVGGLQVDTAGGWVAVPPLPGTLVVNIGDLLARWSNDRLTSNPHRVVNSPTEDRYSMAFFLDPAYDTVVDPRDVAAPDEAVHYPPVVAGEHIGGRFESAFAYRKVGRP